jgi:hypothetical protein
MIKNKESCYIIKARRAEYIIWGFICGLPFFGFFIWPFFYQTIIDHKSPDKLDLICGLIAFIITFPPFLISLLMVRASRLILAENNLLIITLFRTLIIPLSEIQKVESLLYELKIVFPKENGRKPVSIKLANFSPKDVGILINYLNDRKGKDSIKKEILDPLGYYNEKKPSGTSNRKTYKQI